MLLPSFATSRKSGDSRTPCPPLTTPIEQSCRSRGKTMKNLIIRTPQLRRIPTRPSRMAQHTRHHTCSHSRFPPSCRTPPTPHPTTCSAPMSHFPNTVASATKDQPAVASLTASRTNTSIENTLKDIRWSVPPNEGTPVSLSANQRCHTSSHSRFAPSCRTPTLVRVKRTQR